MKHLKLYEVFAGNFDESANRKRLTKEIVDKMIPRCEDVAQNIKDIFLEWTDDGIELDNVELCVVDPTNKIFPLSVYYPLAWTTYKRGNPANGLTDPIYYPIYGNTKVDNEISSIIQKTGKLYYNIVFANDVMEKGKNIQNLKYGHLVDWDADDVQHLFKIVKDCADDMWNRINSMYNVKLISSSCYLPEAKIGNGWITCKPIPDERTSRINWILEIT